MAPTSSSGDIRWIDGLRGIASFLVVNAHIARSIAPILLSPLRTDGTWMIWQLPIIRNLFMGRASIACFAIVSGYVNGLKTIRLTREGAVDIALPTVAKTAFRRTGRFILPSVTVTIITWLLCQLGLFKLGEIVDWAWIRDTSPRQSLNAFTAFGDLFLSLGKTWVDGGNAYDPVQWTLCYLLRGSMLVYLTLFATAFVQPKLRYGLYVLMYAYYFWLGDAVIGINIYVGLILAEMTNDPNIIPYMSEPGTGLMSAATGAVAVGLYCISYPEADALSTGWSAGLSDIGHLLFPAAAELDRFWPAVGSQIIVLGLCFVPYLKSLLCWTPLVWMGKVSFAIYLIHGPLMRSLLAYMVFGWSEKPMPELDEASGQLRTMAWVHEYSSLVTGVAVVLFYLALYRAAGAWVRWVDPACGRLAKKLEDWLFVEGESGEKGGQPVLSS